MNQWPFAPLPPPVIPVKAGIQLVCDSAEQKKRDASLRWHDGFKVGNTFQLSSLASFAFSLMGRKKETQ